MKYARSYVSLSTDAQERARYTLRKEIKDNPKFGMNDLAADVILEQVWNVLTGLDKTDRGK
jgi:hypothetical protein